MNSLVEILHFPNTLPAYVKLLIDFHNNYRRKCKNIYPWILHILRFRPQKILSKYKYIQLVHKMEIGVNCIYINLKFLTRTY